MGTVKHPCGQTGETRVDQAVRAVDERSYPTRRITPGSRRREIAQRAGGNRPSVLAAWKAWVEKLGGGQRPDFRELNPDAGIVDYRLGDLLHAVDNRGVVAVAQKQPYLLEGQFAV